MADVSKAQKLASARKKFKELKKEKKKISASKAAENVESGSTSRGESPMALVEESRADIQHEELPTYFSTTDFNNVVKPDDFFDKVAYGGTDLGHVYANGKSEEIDPIDSKEDAEDDIVKSLNPDLPIPEVTQLRNEDNSASLSSVESLKQLSEQVAELISSDFVPGSVKIESQLEVRNQELAALLSDERIKSEHLNNTLLEYQAKVAQLEAELRHLQMNIEHRSIEEVSNLREQLQNQFQTVGILVAEKAELTANVNQFQSVATQKTVECEELQGRLKTSRSRVADLEREIANLRNIKVQDEAAGKEQIVELTNLRNDYKNLKDEREELKQDLLELRQKLKNSTEDNLAFQQQIAELSNQLSRAQIKIQQLTSGETGHVDKEVELLTQEKFALQKQLSELSVSLKTMSKERDESNLQYQQYAQQLNAQISSLSARLDQIQKENESLHNQEQSRIKHIGDLEKQLQNIQVHFAPQKTSNEATPELNAALDTVEKLKSENFELQEENFKILNEKEVLLRELDLKTEDVKELQSLIEELKGSQPDNVKLLAIMESDKVAAARAVSQNNKMKNELESMQEVFDKLNKDKIELTEQLTTEQHRSRELFEKLKKTELHLQTLADAIEIKDKELSHLRESLLELDKQVLHSEQLTDRLRHYEAQNHSSHSLQLELQEARHTILKLTNEINDARQKVEDSQDVIQLTQKLDLQEENKEPQIGLTEEVKQESAVDTNHNNQLTVLDQGAAMKQLEAKFLKTMDEVASLREEKQRLEHLVLQLQGETETIGEYVALYQHQRSILKQKAIEKDQQLTQLANDREHMKNKLNRLNDLVNQLVIEKGAVPPELLKHNSESQGLCEEHAKINSEIHKIAQNGFQFNGDIDQDRQGSETAEKIIALLSEIKTSNLVQPGDNFHHCPWCSGQLITV